MRHVLNLLFYHLLGFDYYWDIWPLLLIEWAWFEFIVCLNWTCWSCHELNWPDLSTICKFDLLENVFFSLEMVQWLLVRWHLSCCSKCTLVSCGWDRLSNSSEPMGPILLSEIPVCVFKARGSTGLSYSLMTVVIRCSAEMCNIQSGRLIDKIRVSC